MVTDLPSASRRLLDSVGLEADVHVFPEGTKTAEDAAAAIGCQVSAIVKSLVFVVDDEPVVALVPGDLRLDTAKLAAVSRGNGRRESEPRTGREATGFAAGGTPPFGHADRLRVFADPALGRHDPVWCAAGTPTPSFPDFPRRPGSTRRPPTWVEVTVTSDTGWDCPYRIGQIAWVGDRAPPCSRSRTCMRRRVSTRSSKAST